jgi:uncharacterized protein (DUF697 family)
VTMYKKKLPKAITETTASARVASFAAAGLVEPDQIALESQEPDTGSEATVPNPEPETVIVGSAAPSEAAGTTPETNDFATRRRAVAIKMAERFSVWSGAAGLIPIPFVDLAAVGGLQLQMLRRISQIYEVPFSENRGKALIASLAGATIPATSVLGAASMVKSVPAAGTAVSTFVTPALYAGATFAIGMAFIQHFTSGGTLLDFSPPDYREFIKAQKLRRSRRF